MIDTAAHIEEIERAVVCGTSSRDLEVVESWQRCVEQHGLDPAKPGEAYIVPEHKLKEHRQQSEQLIRLARSGLQTLFHQVAGKNYVLLLSDTKGVTVDFFGDSAFGDELQAAGLYLGAEWSEARAGTCGVGACILSGETLTIHQTDHFDVTHTPLSCTAAPIYSTSGNLCAVLDISLLRSPRPKASQALALHLVESAARRIELANLMSSMRKEWVLQLAASSDFLDVDPDAAIALDANGRIIGWTNNAARILSRQNPTTDRKQPHSIMKRPVSDFFDLDLNKLPGFSRSISVDKRQIRLNDGTLFYARSIEPPTKPGFRSAKRLPEGLLNLSGEDKAMRDLQEKAAKLACTPFPILIHGETGSGKEYLARAIHAARVPKGPFVAVNCAAIPEALIEGELFGHGPGAFTGALQSGRKGLLETADGGLLFLDEIGDMPLPLQGRLLRFLSGGELMRVGETQIRKVNVKVVSATHQNLSKLVEEGLFRADLMYRMAVAALKVPPLRERTDFDWVLNTIINSLRQNGGSALKIDPTAVAHLRQRDWPGNIRELTSTLEVAAALSDSQIIRKEHIPEPLIPCGGIKENPPLEQHDLGHLLNENGWNIAKTALALGVNRTTIYRRIKRLRLEAPAYLKRH